MDIYTEILLDHYRNPHHAGKLDDADVFVHEVNASCGDSVDLYLKFDEKNVITNVGFTGSGCTISQASMSMLSDELIGKTLEDVQSLTMEYIEQLLGIPISPGRSKCALLSIAAAKKATHDAMRNK